MGLTSCFPFYYDSGKKDLQGFGRKILRQHVEKRLFWEFWKNHGDKRGEEVENYVCFP